MSRSVPAVAGPAAHDPAASERARGALLGLAAGDALGMPTQCLDRRDADRLLGDRPAFVAAPPEQPVCPGLPAGSTTDDTAQALLLADLLIDGGGRVDPRAMAEALLGWQQRMAASGSLDLLGPSTLAALTAVRAGADPATTGRAGTTNGAAMRVTPVGIATPAEPLAGLLDAVVAAGAVTHDTGQAHAGAAAVAAVVAAGVDGARFTDALPLAVRAAAEAGRRGAVPDRTDVASRLAAAIALVDGRAPDADTLDAVAHRVGTSLATHESVPAAFAVAALSPDDPWRAGWLGARLGGDSDTVAAIAGAVTGACCGAGGIPADAVAALRAVNDLDLAPRVAGLLALRRAAGQ